MNISGQVVKTSQLPKKTLGLGDSLLALINSPLETVTVPVSEFVTFVSNQIALGTYTLDTVTTAGNTTTNVINVGGVNSPYLQLNTVSPGSQAVGRFVWNDTDGTVDLRLKGNNVTLQLGQETVVRVVNKTGADLLESQYKVVRVRIASEGGAQGQRLAVVLAQGNNDPDSVTTLGIVTEDIGNNQEGFITVFGNVNGINTTGSLQGETWADGDVLFLSPTTPGSLTKVKPVAPNHTVVMGYVVYAHGVNGKIFVKVDNGYEIDELHNVKITSVANNDLLQYDSTQQVWKNVTVATAVPTPTLAAVTTAGNTTSNSIIYSGATEAIRPSVDSTGALGASNYRWLNVYTRGVNSGANSLDILGTNINLNDNSGNIKLRVFGSTGNVVIQNGGTFTDAGYRLDVNGVVRMQNSASSAATTGLRLANSAVASVTAGQGVQLDFANDSGFATSLSSSTIRSITTNTANGGADLLFLNYDGSALTEYMRITRLGNVGIGTTSPGAKLEINGNSYQTGLRISDTTSHSTNLFQYGTVFNINSQFLGDSISIQPADYFKISTYSGGIVERLRVTNGGNLLLGTTTDSGYKLDVNGTARVQGTTTITPAADTSAIVSTGYSVTGSGTTPLIDLSGTWNTTGTPTLIKANLTDTASNASSFLIDLQVAGSSQFRVRKDGYARASQGFVIGTSNGNDLVSSSGGESYVAGGLFTSLRFASSSTEGYGLTISGFNASTRTNTSGAAGVLQLAHGFAPTSGVGTFIGLLYRGTINQTGGASGVTRGLYVNPTLTAAADWRSIEWSNNSGWGLYGVGTAPNYLGGSLVLGTTTVNASALLQVESTTKGFLPPRMTTAQILLISSPAEGLQVYNTDLKTICFYNGTAWQRVTSTAM